jgi:Nif-specific regulatory protein
VGVVLVETDAESPLSDDEQTLLKLITETVAISVENGRLHTKTVEKLQANMHEMNMLHQIDRELNDTIRLDHVFNMTLDWALRFTNAHAASLALYDEDRDTLRIHTQYGYEQSPEQLEQIRPADHGGITQRVARSGRTEIIPDVSMDQDYIIVAPNIHSQMGIPVLREDRVIAVITLESKKLNGFTDDHIEFVEKLATRAPSRSTTRLFTETARERERLSQILRNIADIVIVIV